MAITWTKSWAGSDDGSLLKATDLKNIQDDLASVIQTSDTATLTALTLSSGVLTLTETSTPTAVTNNGKVYTKNDNKIYFQDGAGTEHEIAYA